MVRGVVMLGNSEAEGVRARAAFNVNIVVGVSATLIVDGIMPSKLLTSILIKEVVCAVIDYEVECVNVSAR